MRKRWFVFLLTLVLALSALPGAAAAAEAAAPPEPLAGGTVSPARGRPTRLGSLTQTETFDISAATRKTVGNLIVAGLKNRSGEIDVSAYGLTVQEGYDLYYEVLDAHYELFYVRSGFSYNYSGTGITSIQPLYDTTYSQSDVAAFNALCASIVAGIPQGTNAEKLLYLHDYLVTHCEYDLTYSRTNAYNALVEGRAVCDGYSKAYKILCDLAGLTCEIVSSKAINHSWNMVQVKDGGDDAYYYIDCTWDDPTNTAQGLTAESCCMHENFLLSKAECAVKHKSSDWVNGKGESVYGYTTGTKYQNFWWRELIRPVQWVGTQMCYAKPDEVDQVFFRSSGAASETGANIPGGGALWYVWDNPGSYYVPLSYITIASDGGSFYCSTPTQIWKLTPGGEMTLFYTLSSAEQAKGYLYGIRRGADGLIYYIGQDPMQSSVASGILNIPASAASTVPVLVSAKATAGQITVKWSAVTSAAKYAVYRKAAGESSWTRLTNTVTGTSYIDKSTDLKAGITYYYTVRAYVGGTWGGYDTAGVSAKAVASTTPVLTGATAAPGQITVKWGAVTSATKYAVYRKAAGESSWTRLTNTVTGTSYIDKSTDLKAGTTYYYTVRAYVGGAWGGYDAAGVSAKAVAASVIPVLTGATAAPGQITVKWKAVTSATKYALYRKAAGESSWTRLTNTITGTSYIDKSTDLKAGTTYYYTVRAYVGGAWGGYDAAGVSAKAVAASVVPVLTGATAAPGQITVKWSAVTSATKYAVYRKAAGATSWTRLTNTVTGTSYTDKSADLKAGTTYYYTVRAYVSGAWRGYDAAGVSAKASDIPVLVSAAASAGQIAVNWKPVNGATKYAVYRKAAGATSWTRLTNTATATSYVDTSTDLVAGTTYYYTVRAYVGGTWGGYDAVGVGAKAK